MTVSANKENFRLGFLTAIEISDRGYVGGLLVTNHFGRPLEFQCTAPVKPNRTQEILYGPTLAPFLLGELIGRTLLDKVGVKPHLVLTERPELLDLRAHVDMPVACVDDLQREKRPSAESETPSESQNSLDSETSTDGSTPRSGASSQPGSMTLGRQKLRFHAAHPGDERLVANSTRLVPHDADLREPFERVREALQETVRMGALS